MIGLLISSSDFVIYRTWTAQKLAICKGKKDFVMAIIRRKNGANKLVNHEAVNDDNSVFEMNPETMEKPHLFRGDAIMNFLLYPTIPFYSQNLLPGSSIKLKSTGKFCCSTMMVKDSRPISGEVHVIIGLMFAGKSIILLRQIQFEADNGRKIAMIKFAKDTRYAIDLVVTHDGAKIQCLPLSELSMLHSMLGPDAYNKRDKTAAFLKLRRWWKDVDLFRKTYVFLPIHGEFHEADMRSGEATYLQMTSLQAFWPSYHIIGICETI